MKILLLPANNSLSHIAKCLALKDPLEARGHEVVLAASKSRSQFLKMHGYDHHILPDIQEIDNASLPTFNWFRNTKRIAECIHAEVDLINKEKIDRILGVFRFTGKASASIAGVPYDSLISGCMIPDSAVVLGYSENEIGYDEQKEYLDTFYWYAAEKMNRVFKEMGLSSIDDIRLLLKGQRTFLWDFPEFTPCPVKSELIHVGPILWNHWSPEMTVQDIDWKNPIAVVSFGTGRSSLYMVERIIKILLKMGYKVIFAAGGQRELMTILPEEPKLFKFLFAPLQAILPTAALIISHGGQMTVFESLIHKVPVVVMPYQPEQLHNGLCLERLQCGMRLIIPAPFRGNTKIYEKALEKTSDLELETKINAMVNNPLTSVQLENMSKIIINYNGPDMLAELIEG